MAVAETWACQTYLYYAAASGLGLDRVRFIGLEVVEDEEAAEEL